MGKVKVGVVEMLTGHQDEVRAGLGRILGELAPPREKVERGKDGKPVHPIKVIREAGFFDSGSSGFTASGKVELGSGHRYQANILAVLIDSKTSGERPATGALSRLFERLVPMAQSIGPIPAKTDKVKGSPTFGQVLRERGLTSTGKAAFYLADKVTDHETGQRYQVSMTATLIA